MEWLAEWFIDGVLLGIAAVWSLWLAGAIYYDLCRETTGGGWLARIWVIAVFALFVLWQPVWQPFLVWSVCVLLFMTWWFQIKPSHEHEWEPSVAVLPHAVRRGDAVTFENVRNFEYRSLSDFTPRYETRTYHLSRLRAVDILFIYWGSPWMSHPSLVFDFGPEGRICFSIEARHRKGQGYSVIRSLYRQQELIFVAADERDMILRRTKYGHNQDTYLYRIQATPEESLAVFLDYVQAINRLHDTPRWYHGLCANCTTSFFRLPGHHFWYDWRVILNGRLDQALYEAGRLDRSLPFQELRQMAYLNDIANRAPEAGFGDHIRREIERNRHERRRASPAPTP